MYGFSAAACCFAYVWFRIIQFRVFQEASFAGNKTDDYVFKQQFDYNKNSSENNAASQYYTALNSFSLSLCLMQLYRLV